MTREEMIELRDHLIRGNPPYEVDQMGNLRRGKGGIPGLDELKVIGDYDPGASATRMLFDTIIKLIDHNLERMRRS